MKPADRRSLLLAAASALALPLLSSLPTGAAAHGFHFSPPRSPMLYTRRLVRELPGGASFAVSRSFEIRFNPAGRGFRVTGEQVAVEVSAPPSLAPFAQMERERRELGLFPLDLDDHGRIFGAGGGGRDEQQLEAALVEVRARLAASDLSPADRAHYAGFVSAVHQSASSLISRLPADLFAPVEMQRSVSRELALPDGEAGRIVASFQASTDPLTGLMLKAEREVVSELAGDSRRIVEMWELSPLG